MLSIKTIGASSSSHLYYAKYCQEKGEAEGIWVGHGASSLGLSGRSVSSDDMEKLLQGFDPKGKALCKNAGPGHRGGWDMTFSCPKSWSVVWAGGDEHLREKMEQAVKKSAQYALDYMQKEAAFSRVGQGGQDVVPGKLVASQFFHSSNRDGDPQAHVHMVVKNVAQSPDGSWRTLDGKWFFQHKMACGSAFKVKLAEEAMALGLKVRKGKDSFEVVGVPDSVCEAMSGRSKAIEDRLAEMGYTRETASPEMIQKVTLDTRADKKSGAESRRDFVRWRRDLAKHGFTIENVYKIVGRSKSPLVSKGERKKVYAEVLKSLTEAESVFSKTDLHHAVGEACIGKVSGEFLKEAYEEIQQHRDFVKVGPDKFTTLEMFRIERDIVRGAYLRQGEGKHLVPDRHLKTVLDREKFRTIKPEQLDAAKGICQSRSAYSLLRGFAGAGKTYTLSAVGSAYEEAGYKVIGCSLSNKATQALRDEAGVESHTIHSLLLGIKKPGQGLTKKHVVILDEAGMVDSRLLEKLSREVNRAGAKMVMVGDEKQIQPIQAGQMFSDLHGRFEGNELKEVVRQYRDSEAQAILKIRDGDALSTLKYYEGRYGLKFDEAQLERVLPKWIEKSNENRSMRPVFYAKQAGERENRAVRAALKDKGWFKESVSYQRDGKDAIELAPGDQIRFTASSKVGPKLSKDEVAVVRYVSPDKVVVRDQQGKVATFDPRQFQYFEYGYVIGESQYRSEKGLKIAANLEEAKRELLGRWKSFVKGEPSKSYLLIASTNAAVDDLNTQARSYLQSLGQLKGEKKLKTEKGEILVAPGERLLITRPDKKRGLFTNDILTVKSFEDGKLILAKANDGHKSVEISVDPKRFNAFKHGYAITSHKSQATTVDRSFVLVDSAFFDAEKFYVALSRSRGFSQLVINKEIFGGLSDDIAASLKNLPKEQAGRAYYEAIRSQAGSILSRSRQKISSQHGRSKEDIMKLTVSDRLDHLKKRAMERTESIETLRQRHGRDKLTELEKIAQIAKNKSTFREKVTEVAARKAKQKLQKAIIKSVLKI